ncbi:DNA-binding Lrp family transcriptional regulator [Streptosporangium becharense]|uniref:DNA-binding Lrp family transcriptional regulator n=1 Tax=Streptosporangium becharense TaxID=1816182 RepID=A0A7W9IN64_9ACTN|nr:DNA-binding Lrp family transcriptional regulator [Streptosporangium becharense]MBB5823666.1 DNA-binding Lrp family transcriptional regulator [Streptosporangium becharense]
MFHLAQDGRLSNVELARRVGLTPPPCLRRVKRLEDAGVIAGYRAQISPAALGRSLEVVLSVDIAVNDLQTVEEFESRVAALEEVVEFRRMFGRPDYYIRVAVTDPVAYETFLSKQILPLPAVSRVDSHLTMKRIKD